VCACSRESHDATPAPKWKHQLHNDSDSAPLVVPGLAASKSQHTMPADPNDADRYQVNNNSLANCLCLLSMMATMSWFQMCLTRLYIQSTALHGTVQRFCGKCYSYSFTYILLKLWCTLLSLKFEVQNVPLLKSGKICLKNTFLSYY